MTLEKIIKKGKKTLISALIAAQAMSINSCSNPLDENSSTNYIEFQEEQTNSEGEVIFENGEIINIIDSETHESIENIIVNYYHDESENYKIITIQEENEIYLPAIRYLEDFSAETIELQNPTNQGYTFRELNEENDPFKKFLREAIETESQNRETDCSNYITSITGETLLNDLDLFDVAISYIVPKGGIIIEAVHLLQNLEAILNGYPNFEEMTLANNWDVYNLEIPGNQQVEFQMFIESNQPQAIMYEPTLEGRIITLTSEVKDKTIYEDEINGDMIDKTIPCAGNTEEHNFSIARVFRNIDTGYSWAYYSSLNPDSLISTETETRAFESEIIDMDNLINYFSPGNWESYTYYYDDTSYEINQGTSNTIQFTIEE